MGTLLIERGIPCPAPGWSAHALRDHPDAVCAIHREYDRAGAHVHTANTFRTQPDSIGGDWKALTARAIDLARSSVAPESKIAGSIAPLADCYRPDLSPLNPLERHTQMAHALAAAGVDLLIVETFPHVQEAIAASQAAVSTGLPVWVSFTAGYRGDLLSPAEVRAGAKEAVRQGVQAVLVNCTPATVTLDYVQALNGVGAAVGAYANAGHVSDALGLNDPSGPERYADLAHQWIKAGASIVGGCCGTGPAHTAELHRRFGTICDQTVS